MGPVSTSAGSLLAKDAFAPSRLQRRHLSSGVLIVRGNAGVTDQHCIKVSLITLILQYRFATPKLLKTRPEPDRCKTVRLCKPGPLQFSFSLVLYDSRSVLAVQGPIRRFAPWTAPGRSEESAVEFLPFGFLSDWFMHRLVAPTTCSLLLVLYYLYGGQVSAENSLERGQVSAENSPEGGTGFSVENSPESSPPVDKPRGGKTLRTP